MAVKLFQEQYRELPIFQRYMDILIRFVPAEEGVLEEIATRLLMAAENGLNWDTLCMNCGVLMDDNYAQYVEIQRLKEKEDNPEIVICAQCGKRYQEGHTCDSYLF